MSEYFLGAFIDSQPIIKKITYSEFPPEALKCVCVLWPAVKDLIWLLVLCNARYVKVNETYMVGEGGVGGGQRGCLEFPKFHLRAFSFLL